MVFLLRSYFFRDKDDNSEEVYQIYDQGDKNEGSLINPERKNAKNEEESYYKLPQRYEEGFSSRDQLPLKNKRIEEAFKTHEAEDEDLDKIKQNKIRLLTFFFFFLTRIYCFHSYSIY